MRSDWRDRLLAYDEPHLDPSERAALERLLDENPEARALLASLRADREVFRQAFATVAARPGFADGVMRRLPAPRRSW
ncbi:MAG: anti-sigma factor, partial [Armatimonadetes bacterium]|nr:anti-sigma factor [Armatimonadota bacterium]